MTDINTPDGSGRIDGVDKNPKATPSTITHAFGKNMNSSSEKNLILITGFTGSGTATGYVGLYRFNTYANDSEIYDITSTGEEGLSRQGNTTMSVDGTVCAIVNRPSTSHYVNMYRTEDDWETFTDIAINTGITNLSYTPIIGCSGNGEFMCVAVQREIRIYQWDGISDWVYRDNIITGHTATTYNYAISLSNDGSKLLYSWHYGDGGSSHSTDVRSISAVGIIGGAEENSMFNKTITMAYEGDYGYRYSSGKLYVSDFSIFNGGEVLAYDTLQLSGSPMESTEIVKGNYSIPLISIKVGTEIHVLSPADTGTAPDWSNVSLVDVIPMDDFPPTISSYSWEIISDGLLMLRYEESSSVYKLIKIYYK